MVDGGIFSEYNFSWVWFFIWVDVVISTETLLYFWFPIKSTITHLPTSRQPLHLLISIMQQCVLYGVRMLCMLSPSPNAIVLTHSLALVIALAADFIFFFSVSNDNEICLCNTIQVRK